MKVFDRSTAMLETPVAHVDLADWADCMVVVPATANIMAKMAYGIADDAASTTLPSCSYTSS